MKKVLNIIKDYRLTGISTPFGGLSWDYRKDKCDDTENKITADYKIKVFISSKCGDHGRYDRLRENLKKQIEATGLATVYLFGDRPSTTTAFNDYMWTVEDSDLCIFIIDNKDGIPQGVQNEIDTVNKNNIKSLYYFCSEKSSNKTQLQLCLEGAGKTKYKEISSFEELINNGAKHLIEEIVKTYHLYCSGRLIENNSEIAVSLAGADIEDLRSIEELDRLEDDFLPKVSFKNIEKSSDFIIFKAVGQKRFVTVDGQPKTSKLDEYELELLEILYGERTIDNFSTENLLVELKDYQKEDFFKIVNVRWNAIIAYFNGNLDLCNSYLQKAFTIAKEVGASAWLQQDILIDIRNINFLNGAINNTYSLEYQEKLEEFEEQFHYPVLDRINKSIEEKYIKGLYKKKMDSPNTVYIGSDLSEYGNLFASILLIAMYNGSLTQIRFYMSKMKEFMFYLAEKYDDWIIRKNLLKYAVVSADEKELSQIVDAYPELMNKMDKDNAIDIVRFCSCLPIIYEKKNAYIKALGVVGYYLSDEDFDNCENYILEYINDELNQTSVPHLLGNIIFRNLKNVAKRLNQNNIMEVCLAVMKKNYSSWYMDMFKFVMAMDFSDIEESYRQRFIIQLENLLFDDNGSTVLSQGILPFIRNADRRNTVHLDELIKERYPEYFYHHYLVDTCDGDQKVYLEFINELKESIASRNSTQGRNGRFAGYARRDYYSLRILLNKGVLPKRETIQELISLSIQTVCESNESILTKIDSIEFLILLLGMNPEYSDFCRTDIEGMYNRRKEFAIDDVFAFTNVEPIALEFCITLLYSATTGKDKYFELMEMISLIKDDKATLMMVVGIIRRFYEQSCFRLSERFETALFSNVLLWIQNANLEIRWNACKILFSLSKHLEETTLVDKKLYELMENDCVYIKLLILNNLEDIANDKESYSRFIEKALSDANYLLRKRAIEISN